MGSLNVITTNDTKRLNKVGRKEEPRRRELLELINKVAWARGQDTLMTTAQAHTMAERLAAETQVWDYNRWPQPNDTRICLPDRTGPVPLKKAGLVAAGVAIAGAFVSTAYTACVVAIELLKGNITLDAAAGVGLVSAAMYGLSGAISKIGNYISKTSREIYQKFAQNVEASIVRELDALLAKKESDDPIKTIASGVAIFESRKADASKAKENESPQTTKMTQDEATRTVVALEASQYNPEGIEKTLNAIKESVENAKLENA